MKGFLSAFWAEGLKARRSMISPLTAAAVCLLPLAGALFIYILQDPVRARQMGLISAKAQLMVGVADWPSYFGILLQGMAAAGAVIFALIAAWTVTTLVLLASPILMRVLGPRGVRALERLMGMILVLIGTQMLLNGVRDFLLGLEASS